MKRAIATNPLFYTATVLIAAFVLLSLPQQAEAKGPLYEYSVKTKMSHKFLRGVGNVGFGWVEIPLNMHEEIQNLDPFTGSISGFGKGVVDAACRTGVGVVEIVTFPAPYPDNYAPVLKEKPEFVMMGMD